MKSLCISDLHLSAERPEVLSRFLAFIEDTAATCNRLYILGDLFDVWVGDDDSSVPIPQVKDALVSLVSKGDEVILMHGNRDFLIGDDFVRDTGVKLAQDPLLVDFGGIPTLLMHGDLLCTDDLAYQQARLFLRNPATIADFLSRSLEERHVLAAGYRKQSGEATSLNAEDIMDVNEQSVTDYLKKFQAKRLVHGHTHRPGMHEVVWPGGSAMRYVLPEWQESGAGYLEFIGSKIVAEHC